jgi:hypothetical protein
MLAPRRASALRTVVVAEDSDPLARRARLELRPVLQHGGVARLRGAAKRAEAGQPGESPLQEPQKAARQPASRTTGAPAARAHSRCERRTRRRPRRGASRRAAPARRAPAPPKQGDPGRGHAGGSVAAACVHRSKHAPSTPCSHPPSPAPPPRAAPPPRLAGAACSARRRPSTPRCARWAAPPPPHWRPCYRACCRARRRAARPVRPRVNGSGPRRSRRDECVRR